MKKQKLRKLTLHTWFRGCHKDYIKEIKKAVSMRTKATILDVLRMEKIDAGDRVFAFQNFQETAELWFFYAYQCAVLLNYNILGSSTKGLDLAAENQKQNIANLQTAIKNMDKPEICRLGEQNYYAWQTANHQITPEFQCEMAIKTIEQYYE